MKRIILIFSILTTTFMSSFAQSEEYKTTMHEIVDSIQSAKWGTDLMPYANQLERVAGVETKEWLPNYWSAYCYMNKSYMEPVAEKKDLVLEKAEKLIATAEKLMPNNDEIEVLKANIASARMAVDPQNRWQKYGAITGAALGVAQKINPENPRAKLLEAQGIFYTPEAFGGGKQKALPLLKVALEKFEKFKPISDLMPNWGLYIAKYMAAEAEKN
jgi:hypothetical protein